MQIEIDSNVTEVKVRMPDGTIKTFNFLEELEIDVANINNDFAEQSSKYAWWAVLNEHMKNAMDRAKAELEECEADADREVRRDLEIEGIKPTEALIARRIKQTDIYKEKMNAYLKAKRNAGILEKIMKAFEQRLNALISIGANMRNEYNSIDLNTKKNIANKIVGRGE